MTADLHWRMPAPDDWADRLAALESIPTWDEWDPDDDRWRYDWRAVAPRELG